MDNMNYQTINVRFHEQICFIQLHRPDHNNTINKVLVDELHGVLDHCENAATIVVLEGLPDVFCNGADFEEINADYQTEGCKGKDAEPLYDLWLKLATGPYVSISHVRGKVNAGGVGFLAASDIVLAETQAQFSLSELLFGVFPACVLPFLIRKVGFQKAHYLTLMTQSFSGSQAADWGLVDAFEKNSDVLLRKHLLRLRRLKKESITQYKRYVCTSDDAIFKNKSTAVSANHALFSDKAVLDDIHNFVDKGKFPWES